MNHAGYRKLSAKELTEKADDAIINFKGHAGELEKAIGMMFLGRYIGWKPILLIHDKKTIRKYEKILGIDVREVMPDIGPKAEKSGAWRVTKGLSNFWQAVKGEKPGYRSPELKA